MVNLMSNIDKIHKQELENRKDKKLHSRVTSFFYCTLTCIMFALIIFFNLNYYDKASGFRLFMTIIFFVFIILIPILIAKTIILYYRMKRHKKR